MARLHIGHRGDMAAAKRSVERPVEHRGEPRQLAIKHGVITVDTDCAVFDVSPKGAKLLLHTPVNFPDTFKMAIDGGAARTCRVAWRKGNEYGVEFVDPVKTDQPVKEARRSKREHVFDKAMIVYNDGFCTMDCQVLDYSPEGAKLKPLNPRDCPVYFQLRIKHGPTKNCMVLRRTGRDFGVRFLPD
jgi:hypothetical protein